MRWAKIIGFIALGCILGGLFTGYIVFEYMERFEIAWNQWASSQNDEEAAGTALATVKVLTNLQSGKVEQARNALEWRLTTDITLLAAMKKAGRDPEGYTSKAISAIWEYRQANPWSSGDSQLDKMTSDTLNGVAISAKHAQEVKFR